jgi:hypothetical protein
VKAEEAEDAEVILADPGFGVADKADAAGQQVGKAVERVKDGAVPVGVKRVHGEVAALGVILDPGGVGHHGAAAVGFDIAAEGRHLMRLAPRDHGDRAVVDAGGHDLETRGGRNVRDVFRALHRWRCRRRRPARQKGIADAAADEKGAVAGSLQRLA